MTNQARPDNHLVRAILVTLFCCLPMGIVAIIKSSKVNSLYNAGDIEGAYKAAKSSKSWSNWAIGLSIIFIIIYLAVGILAGGLQALAQ